MRENRKIQMEVLDDGDTILSVNFDQNDARHPMTVVGLYGSSKQAAEAVAELMREARWHTSFMTGDGSVPVKWSPPRRDGTTDDIPF